MDRGGRRRRGRSEEREGRTDTGPEKRKGRSDTDLGRTRSVRVGGTFGHGSRTTTGSRSLVWCVLDLPLRSPARPGTVLSRRLDRPNAGPTCRTHYFTGTFVREGCSSTGRGRAGPGSLGPDCFPFQSSSPGPRLSRGEGGGIGFTRGVSSGFGEGGVGSVDGDSALLDSKVCVFGYRGRADLGES